MARLWERLGGRDVVLAKPQTCIPWDGAVSGSNDTPVVLPKNDSGKRSPRSVRKLLWEDVNGRPVPDRHIVLNTCQTPNCVNPTHLQPSLARKLTGKDDAATALEQAVVGNREAEASGDADRCVLWTGADVNTSRGPYPVAWIFDEQTRKSRRVSARAALLERMGKAVTEHIFVRCGNALCVRVDHLC